jgi:hypothetical protein
LFTSANSGKFAINQLVGMAVESIALRQLDPNNRYDLLGGNTPNDRTEELKQQKASFRALAQNMQDALVNTTEAELLNFSDRQRLYGEVEAMRWLQQRKNQAAPGQPQ